MVRVRRLRVRPRHDHVRQGDDERLLPHRRDDHQRSHPRTLLPRAGELPARLHVRGAPGLGGGRAREPRPHEQEGRTSGPRELPTNVRSTLDHSPTSRSSATCAARLLFGIDLVKDKTTKTTFDDDEAERLLRGYLSKALYEAGLICRADDRGTP